MESGDLVKAISDDRLDTSKVVSVLGLKLDLDSSVFMFNIDEKFALFDTNADIIPRRDLCGREHDLGHAKICLSVNHAIQKPSPIAMAQQHEMG